MIAYKGFTKDLRATLGRGRKYTPNELVVEESSKCFRNGLHCAENPLDCFDYYKLSENNVFWLVEAGGSIDEDGTDTKIACTELKLIKELSVKELAGYAMTYIIKHPLRDWQRNNSSCAVLPDKAVGSRWKIAIARGEHPKVKGTTGAALGMIREENGIITAARLIEIDGVKYHPNRWYTINAEGAVVQEDVRKEKEATEE